MKTITPPLGLLEFLERVGSNAKVYELNSTADQLSLTLGCRDSDIVVSNLILQPEKTPRIAIHPWNEPVSLASGERIASAMQVYLLTGYQAQWLPPFGLPHLLETEIAPTALNSACLYVPAGIQYGWMAMTPDELIALTDYAQWKRVFAA